MSRNLGHLRMQDVNHLSGYCRFVCGVLLVFCVSLSAFADGASERDDNWLRMSGFASLGLVNDTGARYPQRDFTQTDTFHGDWSWQADTLLGLQLDATLSPEVSATAQWVLKDRAESSLGESLDWAFLRYRPSPEWMLRAGRLSLDIYLLSDYRNVSFAYLWQRPPTEFYGPLVVSDFDGSDISYSRQFGTGTLRFKLFGGSTEPKVAYTATDALGFDFNPLWGANLAFETDHWRTQAALVRVRFDSELDAAQDLLAALQDPALAPVWPEAAALSASLGADDRHLSFYSLGFSYDGDQWLAQSEVGYLRSEWAALRSIVNAYVSVGRRYDDITPYIVLGMARPAGGTVAVPPPAVSGDPVLDSIYSGARGYANSIQVDQHTVALGARWDVRENVALKFQWDHTQIESGGEALWFSRPGKDGGGSATIDLFSLSANFLF